MAARISACFSKIAAVFGVVAPNAIFHSSGSTVRRHCHFYLLNNLFVVSGLCYTCYWTAYDATVHGTTNATLEYKFSFIDAKLEVVFDMELE